VEGADVLRGFLDAEPRALYKACCSTGSVFRYDVRSWPCAET